MRAWTLRVPSFQHHFIVRSFTRIMLPMKVFECFDLRTVRWSVVNYSSFRIPEQIVWQVVDIRRPRRCVRRTFWDVSLDLANAFDALAVCPGLVKWVWNSLSKKKLLKKSDTSSYACLIFVTSQVIGISRGEFFNNWLRVEIVIISRSSLSFNSKRDCNHVFSPWFKHSRIK